MKYIQVVKIVTALALGALVATIYVNKEDKKNKCECKVIQLPNERVKEIYAWFDDNKGNEY